MGVYLFLFAPILIVMISSFDTAHIITFPLSGFTLRWYQELLEDEVLIRSFFLSVRVGIISALVTAIIGTLAAFGLVRHDFPGKSLFRAALFSPMIVPEVITGVAVLSFFTLLHLPKKFFLLIAGHTMLALPFVVSIVSARLYGFDRSLEEAALNLGANEFRTFWEITLPLIAPGILAGMLIAFTVSFDDFTASLFWTSLGNQTLPIKIFSMLRFDVTPEVNAIGTIIVIFSAVGVLFYQLMRKP
jgi:spermidine/putrescine transport system permease protein